MRVSREVLVRYCTDALAEARLARDHALCVAETLVEGDLLGHSTHGVALMAKYLAELRAGNMACEGGPQVVHDGGNTAAWDGGYLPGPVLVREAFRVAAERARVSGVSTITIARSHHIACLAAYLQAVTDQGLAAILASSSPSTRSVAPFGAVEGVYSPNPIAAGWPTSGDPVLLDVSASITTNNYVETAAREGERLPGHG